MATISTEQVTIERWDDVQHSFSGGGDARSCQCIWPIVSNKEWNETNVEQRREMLHEEMRSGPPPGLLAYVDGAPAGWIRVGPRPNQRRILKTRAIVGATTEALDDPSVWAVTCFVVRREYRGRGLNRQLLRNAIEYARDSGARIIEAYPVDTSEGEHRSNDLFHGALSTFLAQGFRQLAPLTRGRVLVARQPRLLSRSTSEAPPTMRVCAPASDASTSPTGAGLS